MWPLVSVSPVPSPGPVGTSVPDHSAKCWASGMEEEVLIARSCALFRLWGGNPAQEEVTCPGHMAHGRPCHNEIQALRTDLCSIQVRGLHTGIPELSQAFAHLPMTLPHSLENGAFSPTPTEFICIGASRLGHCGSDLRKGCL